MTDTPNFISTYDNVLTSEECKQIIYEFENSKEKQVEGKVGGNEIKIGMNLISYMFLSFHVCGRQYEKY